MVKAAVYCLAGFMVFSALNGAENSAVSGDAALFAGKGSAGIRYFRLGELALENFDSAGAAEFFQQALANLNESSMQIQATDLLLKSLLAANRLNEAENKIKENVSQLNFFICSLASFPFCYICWHKAGWIWQYEPENSQGHLSGIWKR